MQLTINFDLLNSQLKLLVSVLNSKSVAEASKNIIFRVSNDNVTLYSLTTNISAKVNFEEGSYTLQGLNEDEGLFQVPSTALANLLSNFQGGISTPLDVTFKPLSSYEIAIEVAEELETENCSETNVNNFTYRTKPVNKLALNNLDIFEAEASDFKVTSENDVARTRFMLEDMLTYVPNKNRNILHLEKGFATVVTSTRVVSRVNSLGYLIEKGGLTYHALLTLRDIFTGDEDMTVYYFNNIAKGTLLLRNEEATLGIRYTTQLTELPKITELFRGENSITLDKKFLQMYANRIKGVSTNAGEKVTFKINDDLTDVEIESESFETKMRILNSQSKATDGLPNGIQSYSFTVKLEVLLQAFFGKNEGYADDFIISFTSENNLAFVKFSDSSNVWSIVIAQ